MTPRRFTKPYPSPEAAGSARAHYRWLASLSADLVLPELIESAETTGSTLEFAHVEGRTAEPGDLPAVAATLGILHAAARRAGLDRAQVNSRLRLSTGLHLEPFAGPRRRRLHELRSQSPDCPLDHAAIDAWLDHAALLPAALYKDANPRNFITSDTEVVVVDFDSLTLAPVGYDLAKLLVTTSMTYGILSSTVIEAALDAYARELDVPVARAELAVWAEFHDLLTSPYLGRHGYRHPWSRVRPWPSPT